MVNCVVPPSARPPHLEHRLADRHALHDSVQDGACGPSRVLHFRPVLVHLNRLVDRGGQAGKPCCHRSCIKSQDATVDFLFCIAVSAEKILVRDLIITGKSRDERRQLGQCMGAAVFYACFLPLHHVLQNHFAKSLCHIVMDVFAVLGVLSRRNFLTATPGMAISFVHITALAGPEIHATCAKLGSFM